MMTTMMTTMTSQQRKEMRVLCERINLEKLDRFLWKCENASAGSPPLRNVLMEYYYETNTKIENRKISFLRGTFKPINEFIYEKNMRNMIIDLHANKNLPGTWDVYTRKVWFYPEDNIPREHSSLRQVILVYRPPPATITPIFPVLPTILEGSIIHSPCPSPIFPYEGEGEGENWC